MMRAPASRALGARNFHQPTNSLFLRSSLHHPTTFAVRGMGLLQSRRNFNAAAGASDGGKDSGEENKSSSGSEADGDKSRSDDQYDKTGSYDTQDENKRVGNPIQWANPTGGPTMDDHSSAKWSRV